MPGVMAIDAVNTFEACLLMASAPKAAFGGADGEIARNSQGVPQYQVSAAVTYLPGPSGRKISEVIQVTIASPQDPAKDISPGTPILFDRLRCGVMDPEVREGGKVRGGRMFMNAEGIRPALNGHRPVKADAA